MLSVSLHTVATGEVTLSSSDMITFGVLGVKRNRCDVTPLPNTQGNCEESLWWRWVSENDSDLQSILTDLVLLISGILHSLEQIFQQMPQQSENQ